MLTHCLHKRQLATVLTADDLTGVVTVWLQKTRFLSELGCHWSKCIITDIQLHTDSKYKHRAIIKKRVPGQNTFRHRNYTTVNETDTFYFHTCSAV